MYFERTFMYIIFLHLYMTNLKTKLNLPVSITHTQNNNQHIAQNQAWYHMLKQACNVTKPYNVIG